MLDEPVAEDDDPVDPPTIVDPNRPKVLIVGSGLGGLILAILLKDASVPFMDLERSIEIRPIG